MAGWSPWFTLLLGVIIGWLLQWLLDIFYFRRRHAELAAQIQKGTDDLAARTADIEKLHQQVLAQQAQLTAHLAAAAAAPAVVSQVVVAPAAAPPAPAVAAPGAALPAAALAGAGLAAAALRSEEVSIEGPEPVVQAPTVEAALPAVEIPAAAAEAEAPELTLEAPTVAVEAPAVEAEAGGIGLPGAAVVAGLGAAAVAALRSDEVSVETPEVASEAAPLEIAATGEEIEIPGVEAEAAELGLPAVAALVGVAAAATREPEAVVTAPSAVEVPDDFSRIKGIGPKYARLLKEAGITTYADLAATDPERLRSITNPPSWQRIDFGAWISQAQELSLAPRPVRVGDDFTRLEGIGPKYANALKEHGIATFAQLAETDENRLAAIVRPPAWQRVVYSEWIEQARLAAAGDEAGLAELQAALFRREGDKLSLINGIGEKSAAALAAAGIDSYASLASSTPDQVGDVIARAGLRHGDYEAWIAEASLRAAGKRVKRPRRAITGATFTSPCPQDLSRVQGIGDVYEQRLYAAGIGTYWELASTSEADLRSIMDVKDFQDIDLAAIRQAASNLAEETGSFGRAWDGSEPDDLASMEGIGEVFERRLYEAGICTFAAIAASTPERLAEIVQAPAWQRIDFDAWIERARERISAKG